MKNATRQKSGRYLARARIDGKRVTLGTFATPEDAARVAMVAAHEAHRPQGVSLATWGSDWLGTRKAMASHDTQVACWRARIAGTKLAKLELASVQRRDVQAWMAAQTGAEQTKRNALNLLRSALQAAVDAGKLRTNPCADIAIPKQRRTHEPWTYLTPSELHALLACATLDERDIIAFAVGTGLRAGELVSLERADVTAASLTVRYGGPDRKPTKSGKPRRVPLFGLAAAATRSWLARHPEGLWLFESERGCQRNPERVLGNMRVSGPGPGVYLPRFEVLGYQAGLYDASASRPMCWHSLRHTCATMLMSGAWGRAWSIREVQQLLGHASVTTTERYAHVVADQLTAAAQDHDLGSGLGSGGWHENDPTSVFAVPPMRIERMAYGLGSVRKGAETPANHGLLPVATRFLVAAARGAPEAYGLACALAAQLDGPDATVVLGGGPHAHAAGVRLAERVLSASASVEAVAHASQAQLAAQRSVAGSRSRRR